MPMMVNIWVVWIWVWHCPLSHSVIRMKGEVAIPCTLVSIHTDNPWSSLVCRVPVLKNRFKDPRFTFFWSPVQNSFPNSVNSTSTIFPGWTQSRERDPPKPICKDPLHVLPGPIAIQTQCTQWITPNPDSRYGQSRWGSASEPRVGTKVERGRWRVGWGWDKALPAIAIRLDRTNRAFSAPRSLGKIRYLQLALLSDAPCVVVLSK